MRATTLRPPLHLSLPLSLLLSAALVFGASASAIAAPPSTEPPTAASGAATAAPTATAASPIVVRHDFADIDGHRVFYREAGPADAPAILLLHGFPTSSHLFSALIPKLAQRYRVIAPDIPGYGLTEVKAGAPFGYTFDELTQVIARFAEVRQLKRYALYVFDIGAPIGWRLAVAHPEQITAIVSQNGNAYEEGLSPGWAPMRKYWADPSPANREPLRGLFKLETTKWQYLEGVKPPERVAPEHYLLDQSFLDRPGQEDIQLAVLLDYRSNLKQYPALHDYFRRHQPPLLAIWGANDPFFLPAGAKAFQKDLPRAEIHLIEGAGHFALVSHGDEVARRMLDFLDRQLPRPSPVPSPR